MKPWQTSRSAFQSSAPSAGNGSGHLDFGDTTPPADPPFHLPLFARFSRLSLTQRFAIISFGILLTGMLVIGWWVTREIEEGVLNRTATVTASFVSSAVAPQLAELSQQMSISEETMRSLDTLLADTELGQRIVSFKVWSPTGELLFGPDRSIIGKRFVVGAGLSAALSGETVSKISGLNEPENDFERARHSELQETYTPLREMGSGDIIGVVEFYELTGPLREELRSGRLHTWLIVGGATVILYVILVGMVGRASRTISWQRRELDRAETQYVTDRIKDQFVSGVSHELRTPLGFIRGYTSTLLRKDLAIDSDTGREFLQIIDDEAGNLERMIEDLLDTSRIQAGTLAIRPRATGLQELIENALERASRLLEKSGHRTHVRHLSGDGSVLADPERIEQVLFNLLDNSSRYSTKGSTIRVETEFHGESAQVSVIDHGEGIPEDQLEEIFEPFQRGETAATSRTRGTGLGLAVARAIIEAHGGRIWAESASGRGATLIFTLPMSEPDEDDLSEVMSGKDRV